MMSFMKNTKGENMAKTYIDTVKYLIYTDVEVDGLVDKPDVVGAIFGQTEGLLGDELDLRDLQKNGRIGRIEVDLKGKSGKTTGTIKIPSSLDMVETCIIAAALETVDRVGPCEAKMNVSRVEDTRSVKRKALLDRAKQLLKHLVTMEIPESKEITDMVREEVKTAEVIDYGPERLAAGPTIGRSNDIVLVEGRADVINLLKNDITNVIAIGGAKVPKTIVDLSKRKEVTIFLDGDRGGDIILNELTQGGVDIDFVARAPTGMEVEELTRKEIIKCIRNKVPFEQGAAVPHQRAERFVKREPPRYERREEPVREQHKTEEPVKKVESVQVKQENIPKITPTKENLLKELDELSNTLNARFYNSSYERVAEVPVRDVIKKLSEIKDSKILVFDGIITQRLVDLAAKQGVDTLVGIKMGNVNKTPEGLDITTKS